MGWKLRSVEQSLNLTEQNNMDISRNQSTADEIDLNIDESTINCYQLNRRRRCGIQHGYSGRSNSTARLPNHFTNIEGVLQLIALDL